VVRVSSGPAAGLAGQVAVLAGLDATAGLSGAGWLTGLGFGLAVCLTLSRGLGRSGRRRLGPGDRVTLARATLVGGLVALVVTSVDRPVSVAVLVWLATVALLLDAVDGVVARRTGTVTTLGARFDYEVDSVLLLVLCGYAVHSYPGWVLAIGLMRYAYVAAGWVLPWLRGPLPPRYWRKVVAAIQGVVLVTAASGVVPRPLMIAVLAASLALLAESFGRDVLWRWRHRPAPVTVSAWPG
jgi:phosphatidylglycerophosphate synthase